jgi:ATP-dependent DNA helicase RecG
VFRKDVYDEEYLRSLNLNERQIKAVMYVKEKGQITNKEYQEVCATSNRTASRDLADLVSSGLFDQVGITGKGTVYIISYCKDAKDATKTPNGPNLII